MLYFETTAKILKQLGYSSLSYKPCSVILSELQDNPVKYSINSKFTQIKKKNSFFSLKITLKGLLEIPLMRSRGCGILGKNLSLFLHRHIPTREAKPNTEKETFHQPPAAEQSHDCQKHKDQGDEDGSIGGGGSGVCFCRTTQTFWIEPQKQKAKTAHNDLDRRKIHNGKIGIRITEMSEFRPGCVCFRWLCFNSQAVGTFWESPQIHTRFWFLTNFFFKLDKQTK